MSTDVAPDDWISIDTWWISYVDETSPVIRSNTSRIGKSAYVTGGWEQLDAWDRVRTAASPVAEDVISVEESDKQRSINSWEELDSWWRTYAATGHDTAKDIADILVQSNTAWDAGSGPFNNDPLAVAVTTTDADRGPLRPNGEVAWSRWLARLLRPSQTLVTELFDVSVPAPPSEVSLEDRLEKEDSTKVAFRRPDILVRHDELGISIEVKLDDPNYSKTADTARLVEQEYDGEWIHTLLLPKRHTARLDSTVNPGLTHRSESHRQIEWEDPGPVDVLYWQDVTAALRTLLRRGDIVDDHWAANAYLFCALVEQQLLGFQPQEVINTMAEPADVVDTLQPITLAEVLEEQLIYLRNRTEV